MKSSSKGILFDFILLGARKCASTSLYAALRSHPEVCLPYDKEIDLFGEDELYQLGADFWRTYYPSNLGHPQSLLTGNCHTCYLYHPKVSERLWQHNSALKLIVTIREPVARARSDYFYYVRQGLEKRTFKEAITQQLAHDNLQELNLSTTDRYVSSGLYMDHLLRYIELFGRDRILIVFAEDLAAQPEACLSEVFRFLNIEESFIPPPSVLKLNKSSASILPSVTRGLRQLRMLPNRRTKVLVRNLLGYSMLLGVKQTYDKLEGMLLRPTSFDAKEQDVERLLQEYYQEEIRRVKELIGRIPEKWEARLNTEVTS